MNIFFFLSFSITALASVPSVQLKNAAIDDLTMPAMGLGTGGYGADPSVGYGGYPECWMEYRLQPGKPPVHVGCGNNTKKAIEDWIKLGGRRIDAGDNYGNEKVVGDVIKASKVSRDEIFVTSKVGIICPWGFNETLKCFNGVISDLQLKYLDLLLIHYPTPFNFDSEEPSCNNKNPLFNLTECRLQTWRALIQIFKSGGARAIGVSNWEIEHLKEIITAKLLLPSVNQCHFHPYGGFAQMKLVQFCQAHDIVFNGYSPLGVPDWHTFPGPDMHPTALVDPVVTSIAGKHEKSPAQVIMAWQWGLGIPTNPRSQNSAHMVENMNIYDIKITAEESKQLMSLHQDTCEEDPNFYECAKTKE